MTRQTDERPAMAPEPLPTDREEVSVRNEDEELVWRIRSRSGEKDASARLLEKYWRFLVAWALPRVMNAAEAEDVAQEAFIRAFRALDRLQDPKRFLGWLLRIARNLATDHVRKHREMESIDRIAEGDRASGTAGEHREDIGERIDRGDEMRAVIEAMKDLPDPYRTVILLRYFEGFSGTRIAAILGEPEGTVRNRLFRALAKIRRVLSPDPDGGSKDRPTASGRRPSGARPRENGIE